MSRDGNNIKRAFKSIGRIQRATIVVFCILTLLAVFLLFLSGTLEYQAEIPEQLEFPENSKSDVQQGYAGPSEGDCHYHDSEITKIEDRQPSLYDERYNGAYEEMSEEQSYDRIEEPGNDVDDNFADNIPVRLATPNGLTSGHDGPFELPVRGATGWAAASLIMHSDPQSNSTRLVTLQPGEAFTILEEYGLWWNIRLSNGEEGWVTHRHCFINLPDIIPSIIYNITNAYSSIKRSNAYEIPNTTGYALYEAYAFNLRLGRNEFIVPTLYSTSFRIMQAQRTALADGNTLIIYEVFRPRDTQLKVADNLRNLMNTNVNVYNAINKPPWSIGWFIGTSLSNHQRGIAVDMSLGEIVSAEIRRTGGFVYWHIIEYVEFDMPTAMHELSAHAVLLSRPVAANLPDAWRVVPFAETITEGAIMLVQYATDVGLTPIASEWWHFTDLEGRSIAIERNIAGEFNTRTIYSIVP